MLALPFSDHVMVALAARLRAIGAGALLGVSAFGLAHAESDWKAQLAGLDGVVTSCIDHSDGNYGESLCNKYFDGIIKQFDAAKVSYINLGYFRHDDDLPATPENLPTPLNLVLFIRGTAGNQVAIQMRVRASVTYEAAIEAGAEGPGRSGDLVIWEKSTTGSGPSKQLQPAVVEAMGLRTKDLLKQLATHLGK